MYNYPDAQPDTLAWSSRRHYPDKRFEAKREGKWIPDSFIGPTALLMQAIQDDGVPETERKAPRRQRTRSRLRAAGRWPIASTSPPSRRCRRW